MVTKDLFEIVEFPEIQNYQDQPEFGDNSFVCVEIDGAYFVNAEWKSKIDNAGNKEESGIDDLLSELFCENECSIDNAEDRMGEKGIASRMVDEKIDDGCGFGEADTYVMMRSYDLTYNGTTYYVRFYYGDITRTITSYDVQ